MAIMGAARCRALLLARRGALTQAKEAIQDSLHRTAVGECPLEHGRSLLVYGQLLRRSRQKQEARAVLEQALRVFESLGARLWADRARAELDRVGRGTPSGALTPTERRVAELAAAGSTNRKIAGTLFISPKTVEANLSRVYRKLDISSRAELGAVMAKRDAGPG
jgi:DNA-binding CsgD family transcriptional regulator